MDPAGTGETEMTEAAAATPEEIAADYIAAYGRNMINRMMADKIAAIGAHPGVARQAMDELFGEGTYKQFADELYNRLRSA